MRLAGTTKSTLESIRERTHWNTANLSPMDPVALGMCSQIDLDMEVARANKDRPHQAIDHGATLLPAEVTTARDDQPLSQEDVFGAPRPLAPREEEEQPYDLDSVFAKLKDLKGE